MRLQKLGYSYDEMPDLDLMTSIFMSIEGVEELTENIKKEGCMGESWGKLEKIVEDNIKKKPDPNSVESPETKSDEKQSYIYELETTIEKSQEYIKILEDKISRIKEMRNCGGLTKENIDSRTTIRVYGSDDE